MWYSGPVHPFLVDASKIERLDIELLSAIYSNNETDNWTFHRVKPNQCTILRQYWSFTSRFVSQSNLFLDRLPTLRMCINTK